MMTAPCDHPHCDRDTTALIVIGAGLCRIGVCDDHGWDPGLVPPWAMDVLLERERCKSAEFGRSVDL